jgi:prophage DNA circulation protein
MRITDPRLNTFAGQATWRTHWLQALFREAIFFVEGDSAGGGRRVALHEYPKRNVPYAEDMGRSARTFQVQGYLIGHFYHELKDNLIAALEKDGPGRLRLPMQYMRQDVQVMVQSYSVSESRERGGMCGVQMSFVEYGEPLFRQNIATPTQIMSSAANVEQQTIGTKTLSQGAQASMGRFAQIHKEADIAGVAS